MLRYAASPQQHKRVSDPRFARPMNRAVGASLYTAFVAWGESPQLGSCAEGAEPASTACAQRLAL